eukprot:CAMPEP_0181201966 /NCGR_PEP_ID=MMETSP1096-20121128/18583_1 /TAXON_ID=156174 ORGANISM="Chrysochromulina ericina, Strain CCMP281" /NCGR_SAMPLE_ID=MMETSP1096 /ASSEMBLY_ACC=CAM_ASM_000453 /LENGTH=79 /DNA_ID=CAMNT_0023292433 /DNA_START=692 /DNA_END=931 /DNA_ORIENTATION=-
MSDHRAAVVLAGSERLQRQSSKLVHNVAGLMHVAHDSVNRSCKWFSALIEHDSNESTPECLRGQAIVVTVAHVHKLAGS